MEARYPGLAWDAALPFHHVHGAISELAGFGVKSLLILGKIGGEI